jgi:hypothetical protein
MFEPMESYEFAVETRVVSLVSLAEFLDVNRRDNTLRQSIIDNASHIEAARDRLSRVLDDVGGKDAITS